MPRFSREAADIGITEMKAACEAQKENARKFKSLILEINAGSFKGVFSEKFINSALQHVENLINESNNTKELANSSESAKNIFEQFVDTVASHFR